MTAYGKLDTAIVWVVTKKNMPRLKNPFEDQLEYKTNAWFRAIHDLCNNRIYFYNKGLSIDAHHFAPATRARHNYNPNDGSDWISAETLKDTKRIHINKDLDLISEFELRKSPAGVYLLWSDIYRNW